MGRYLRIIWQFSKISLMSQTAYRPSFILAVFGKLLYLFIVIIFFWVIFLRIPALAGWNFNEMLLLVSIFNMGSFIASFSFSRSLFYRFQWWIYYGDFDIYLTKPINPLVFASFCEMDMMDLTTGIGAIVIFIYALANLSIAISMWQVLLFFILFVCGICFIYAMSLLVSSVFFFTISGRGLGDIISETINIGKFPTEIFSGKIKLFFTYIFPIIMLATLPAEVLLGQINLPLIGYIVGFTIILLLVSYKIWFWALKRYSSASS